MFLGFIEILASYLIGSFCSAIFVSKIFHLDDPRQSGSKNPGATNVLRLSGKKYAAIVLLGDMLKGLMPLGFAHLLNTSPFVLGCMGLAAVLGHIFPLFYEFKGGKGVATALGVMLGLSPILGILCLVIWLVVAKISRYSSLASIVSIISAPIFVLISTNRTAVFPIMLMSVLILFKHKENIYRLKNNEESQINI